MLQRRRVSLRRQPRQERSTFTLEAILEAADQLVAAEGTEAVHMVPLAKRAGVSVGTLYQYFLDKDAILAALLDRACDQLIANLEASIEERADADLDAFLSRVSGRTVELLFQHHPRRQRFRAAIKAPPPAQAPENLADGFASLLARAIQRELAMAPAELLARCRLMVWTADGMLEGALQDVRVARPDVQVALLAAWRGILGLVGTDALRFAARDDGLERTGRPGSN